VDEETQEQFYALLNDLNQRLSLTLVLVSHDLDRIAKEVKHIAVVDTVLRYYEDPQDAVTAERSVEAHH
jgi:ABC-type Mn2+/Zn2+ transport system ATPase subunit